jgi:hypothetical protein
MIRKASIFILFFSFTLICHGQDFIKTENLFKEGEGNGSSGQIRIYQDPGLDTLMSRYIMAKGKIRTKEGTRGIDGYRIQIYYSSVRTAREESAKVRADFISKFPDLVSYAQYEEPGWFMVRAGDYRTKIEAYRDFMMIRKVFPNSYLVPAVINFPDAIRK